MTDIVLSLIPSYGLWVIFFTIALGCLAIPLPGSMLVIAAGSFAAVGDLDLFQALGAALGGYVTGDQTAYRIARIAGPGLLERLKKAPRSGAMIARAETLLRERGVIAIFLSRTIVSPLGPWMSYLCGAAGLKWWLFTATSVVGATLWVAAYGLTGYYFADRLEELASLASNGIGFIAAFAIALIAGWWLWRSWSKYRNHIKESEAAAARPLLEPQDMVVQNMVQDVVKTETEPANANSL